MQKSLKKSFASAIQKHAQMQLTIRTPYNTIIENLTNFKRIITKTTEAILIIQNRMPPALHILPPGYLKIKTNIKIEGFSGDFMHLGGFVNINPDNSCEISLFECIEKNDVVAKNLAKGIDVGTGDTYIYRIKNATYTSFVKKLN